MTISRHAREDLIGGLGPPKGLAVLVVRLDVREDRVAKLRDARMGSALERLLCQQAKESLDEIQPAPWPPRMPLRVCSVARVM